MPVYSYRCPGCARHYDALRSIDERDATQECPHCGYVHAGGRCLTAPRPCVESCTGDFPGAALKWERQMEARRQRALADGTYWN